MHSYVKPPRLSELLPRAPVSERVREALIEDGAVGEDAALRRRPRAELAAARPRGEVRRRLLGADARGAALHTDLAFELRPEEEEGAPRVEVELACLVALVVRVEGEAFAVEPLQEDDARRGGAGRIGGCEHHRVGFDDGRRDRLGEPPLELGERVGEDVPLLEGGMAVLAAEGLERLGCERGHPRFEEV